MKNETQSVEEQIARAFSAALLKEIGEENMRAVVRLNRDETNANVCHSHDFIDANIIMEEVFKGITGRTVCTGETTDAEEQALQDQWNAAWEMAKREHFYFGRLLVTLERLGFLEQDTGGGCKAMIKALGSGLELVCCDGEGPEMPVDGDSVWFGVMSTEHSDLDAGKVYETGAKLADLLADSAKLV